MSLVRHPIAKLFSFH